MSGSLAELHREGDALVYEPPRLALWNMQSYSTPRRLSSAKLVPMILPKNSKHTRSRSGPIAQADGRVSSGIPTQRSRLDRRLGCGPVGKPSPDEAPRFAASSIKLA